jgi:hypothetical protein
MILRFVKLLEQEGKVATEEEATKWMSKLRRNGEQSGYPDCCINFFIESFPKPPDEAMGKERVLCPLCR